MSMTEEGTGTAESMTVVPVRHIGRWVAIAIIAVLLAMMVHTLLFNPNFKWHVIGTYLFNHGVLKGVWHTILLTVVAMAVGIVGGVIVAVMRLSPNPVLASTSWFFVWLFRGTPVLTQLFLWFNLSILFPHLSIGVPFGPEFHTFKTNSLISPFTAIVLAFGLNESAYMSEIVRAGILSVDEGQSEAASALGMRRGLAMRRIVLPQAMRVVVPPTGNETISMLKTTSIAAFLGTYVELTQAVSNIYNANYQVIPLLFVAAIWYTLMTSVLTTGQYYIERYFGRGATNQVQAPTLPARILRALRHRRPDEPTGLLSLNRSGR